MFKTKREVFKTKRLNNFATGHNWTIGGGSPLVCGESDNGLGPDVGWSNDCNQKHGTSAPRPSNAAPVRPRVHKEPRDMVLGRAGVAPRWRRCERSRPVYD